MVSSSVLKSSSVHCTLYSSLLRKEKCAVCLGLLDLLLEVITRNLKKQFYERSYAYKCFPKSRTWTHCSYNGDFNGKLASKNKSKKKTLPDSHEAILRPLHNSYLLYRVNWSKKINFVNRSSVSGIP